MEEAVGKLWHRLVTRASGTHHPHAAVTLKDIERTAGVLFRALGGDGGLRLAAATSDTHGARRGLLARLAGSGEKISRARLDNATLRLPPQIDLFPQHALNRDLYLWLAALAAAFALTDEAEAPDEINIEANTEADSEANSELRRNQRATLYVLQTWPGFAARYSRLVAATLASRLDPSRLPPAEAEREHALRRALTEPGSVASLPAVPAKAPPAMPIPLWLISASDHATESVRTHTADTSAASTSEEKEKRAHHAERVATPEKKHGLLLPFRAESLLSVAEFIKVDRSVDDEADPHAAAAAANLDKLALTDSSERVASKIRFDLDLPSAAEDDAVLGDGIPQPEWDYRKRLLREDYVRVVELVANTHDPRAAPAPLPERLRRSARRLRQQFAALQPGHRWLKAQADGSELDLDAVVRAATDRAYGHHPSEQLHLSLERRERDLACLALADLSLSTDAWVSDSARVIDVIRDALLLFGEALSATGDRFALCGFSSVKRGNVRFHYFKHFNERFDNRARGRVIAIRPGYYTRLGAAIRRATALLDAQSAARRILLILSDGKPNDLDLYDGRYGIEDTRMAVIEARRHGLVPFCVTIDREGASYLPHIFGPAGFAVIRKAAELPARLPLFYAQITR